MSIALLATALLAAIIPIPALAAGKEAGVHGKVLDRRTQLPISEVRLTFTNPSDTTDVHVASSGEDGAFSFAGLAPRIYRLDAARLGYMPLRQTVSVPGGAQDLGSLLLLPQALPLEEFVVKGTPPPALQKSDTTEFNAKAFKTHPDATVGDLLEKMPGITVSNGTVKSNGQTVQQVLVDGKPYFGQDLAIALQNLPAEVIGKIQVFDKLSDQSQFTGFDDGQSIKTINLVLNQDRRNIGFGKIYGGSGSQSRYLTGGNSNILRGDQRISLIGLSDNVNQQNFSGQDLLGVLNESSKHGDPFSASKAKKAGKHHGSASEGDPADFLIGQQDGITSINSVGANAANRLWKGVSANQSYFFNTSDNENLQSLTRQYPLPENNVVSFDQESAGHGRNYNQRYDARVEDTLNTSNSIIEVPRLYFQSNHSSGTLTGADLGNAGEPINQTATTAAGTTSGNDLSNHLIYQHRFATAGRTFSADLGAGYALKNGSGALFSLDRYGSGDTTSADTLDQRTTLRSTTSSLSAKLAYTEALGSSSQIQLEYAPRLTSSESDHRAFTPDPITGAYTSPAVGLSNSFTSRYTTQAAGIAYLLRWNAVDASAEVAYQGSALEGRRTFPESSPLDRRYHNVLPAFTLRYKIKGERNLKLSFKTSTKAPSISELQNVVDLSNPLSLSSGNPALGPAIAQTLTSQLSLTNAASGRSVFLLLSAQRVQGYVATSSFSAVRDTVLPVGTALRAGTRLVSPVNLSGYWNANSFLTFSQPLKAIKSQLNVSGGVTYTRTPGMTNGIQTRSDATTLTQGLVLSSNIGSQVDFIAAYTGDYSIVRTSAGIARSSDTYDHVASFKLNLMGWHGVVLRNELSNIFYHGLAAGRDQDAILWNVGLGEKLLKNDRGDIRLTAVDVLNQNKSVNRTVTGNYVQDTENRTLKPYAMLTFTYTMR